ncbi:MAG: NB-ARC domain-containing protein [Synechococcales bacterium]|nr:NB-ARC domain-containing protein [Synechococcales bacterium]
MATLKASPQGLVRIKQARTSKGWASSDFRWIESASAILGTSWEEDGVLAVGVSEGTWKRFLAGKYPINADAFRAYCQVLGVDWESVVEAPQVESSASPAAPSEIGLHSARLPCSGPLTDWGAAPDVSIFYGRQIELETVRRWIVQERCRLITLLGMGGIGKTSLSVKLAQELVRAEQAATIQYVIWRSLRNAPAVEEVLADLIYVLSGQQETHLPSNLEGKLSRLLHYLRTCRCLLVLDNAESILQAGDRTGRYRTGYEGYGQLLRCIAETAHQSCLVITSREKPQGLTPFEGKSLPVRSLQLSGLPERDGRELFKLKGTFTATEAEWDTLVSRYAGNPLALKIVASSIHDYFDSDISTFLDTIHQGGFLFDDIRALLEQQFQRLTPLERDIMYWLAINREPVMLSELQTDFITPIPQRELVESLNSLQRRSLIEKSDNRFTQQPVVMEYVTTQLVEQLCEDIYSEQGSIQSSSQGSIQGSIQNIKPKLFITHALLKATAKDYIRETQANLIVQPMIDQLLMGFGSVEEMGDRLSQILSSLRGKPVRETGYAAGNAINLLHQAGFDLTGLDCSRLTLWQAYLQGITLHNVDFSHSDLSRCTFTETLGNILWATFSPNGQLLATCDTDCQVRIWDAQSGKLQLICHGHENWVRFVGFSPDGKTLASCGADRTIKLWNVADGVCIKTLTGHGHEVFAVAYSPDGQQLASAGGDRTIKLWDVRDGHCRNTLTGHTDWVRSVAFSPDGKTLASSGSDHTIRVWDVATGACLKTLTGHTASVGSVAFSPDGEVLASASGDRTVKLWDYETGDCLRTYTGHQGSVYAIAFATGDLIVSGSGDRTVKFWDCYSDTCVKTLYGQTNEVCCVAVNANHQAIACVSLDQTMRLWDYVSGQCLKTWYGHTDWALPVAFSPDGRYLASGSNDKTVRLWNWQTGECLNTLSGHTDFIYSVAFSPRGGLLASGSTDLSVRLWQVASGQCVQALLGHTDWICAIAFHPCDPILASASADATVKVWDIRTGQCLQTLTGHTAKLLGVAFSPDGKQLASCGVDQTIKLWDVPSGNNLKTLRGHTSRIWGVAYSPDGQTLASCSTDQTIKLWDIGTGESLKTLTGHHNWVFAVAFSPDGRLLASASHDQTVRIWNPKTGESLQVYAGHAHLVSAIAFSPDSTTIASGSQDQTVRLWNVKRGQCDRVLIAKRLYEGMNLTGVKGLTPATIATLQTLGAIAP